MESKKNILTYEGLRKYEDELHELKVIKRKEVAQKIKEAREQGDLSENAEYDAAKDEQGFVEGRIKLVETMIRNAVIIEEGADSSDICSIGRTVTFQEDGDEPETYQIVGSAEADPFEGRISNDSPIAKGLLGHKVGETVKISTPGGEFSVKIIEVK